MEALNQRRVRGAQSAPQTGARLSNWGSFGLRQARLRQHFRLWKATYHDLTVKMGESGRVRLKWPGIADETQDHNQGRDRGRDRPGGCLTDFRTRDDTVFDSGEVRPTLGSESASPRDHQTARSVSIQGDFYEDKNGLAVVQGDIGIGKVETLESNLIDEIATLARVVSTNGASTGLSKEENDALTSLSALGTSTRSISRAANHPDVQELNEAAARLPLDALDLEQQSLDEFQVLLQTPYGRRVLDKVSRAQIEPIRELLKRDKEAREQVKAGLAELAHKAGVQFATTRSLNEDPVARSVARILWLTSYPSTPNPSLTVT